VGVYNGLAVGIGYFDETPPLRPHSGRSSSKLRKHYIQDFKAYIFLQSYMTGIISLCLFCGEPLLKKSQLFFNKNDFFEKDKIYI
jgi:hypothetical protein